MQQDPLVQFFLHIVHNLMLKQQTTDISNTVFTIKSKRKILMKQSGSEWNTQYP